MPTISSSSASDRSGAIFSSTGVGPALRVDALARVDHPRQQIVERRRLLQIAQPRRVGRRNIDGDVARDRREALDQPHVIGDAVGRVFVGADIDADNAAGARARREPPERRVRALRIEAEPVDHAAIGVEAKHPRSRIARLRLRRDGADFDEAKTRAAAARPALRRSCRSPPPCRPDWGNSARRRAPRAVCRRGRRAAAARISAAATVSAWASSGSSAVKQRPRQTLERADHESKLRHRPPATGLFGQAAASSAPPKAAARQ